MGKRRFNSTLETQCSRKILLRLSSFGGFEIQEKKEMSNFGSALVRVSKTKEKGGIRKKKKVLRKTVCTRGGSGSS